MGWPGLSIGMTLGGFAGLAVAPGPLVLLMSVFMGAHLGATATLLAVGGVVALVAMAVVGVIVGTIGVFSGLITAERRQARIKELQQERIGLSFSLG